MRYYESKFSRFVGSAGFYVIIGCCLLGIGAASWFAISRYNKAQLPPDSDSYNQSDKTYSDNTSSYNSSIPSSEPPVQSDIVNNPVIGEPYESTAQNVAEYFSVPVEGNIIKGYSDTELQYSATYGDMRLHTGVDIACELNTDVKAAGDGVVTAVEDTSLFGKVVTVDHGNGIVVKYCGLSDIKVSVNQVVKAGNKLGNSAEIPCECADQSHVHIEVYKDGKTASPLIALGLG